MYSESMESVGTKLMKDLIFLIGARIQIGILNYIYTQSCSTCSSRNKIEKIYPLNRRCQMPV